MRQTEGFGFRVRFNSTTYVRYRGKDHTDCSVYRGDALKVETKAVAEEECEKRINTLLYTEFSTDYCSWSYGDHTE